MSSTKAALKAAKAAIDAHQYSEAITQAKIVLASDSQNYHANVFLGLASDKRNEYDEAIGAYEAAIKAKKTDPLAYQGLLSLYEKQGSKNVSRYQHNAVCLAELYRDLDDKTRCQTVVDKLVLFARDHGTRAQYKDALGVMLPSSPVYDYLEGRVPHCSYTYKKVADILESEEKERINKEIGERRTRLGAKIDQVTLEVKQEILTHSVLESTYQEIISSSHEDEVRREYEEKLLRHAYDTLTVLPRDSKTSKLKEIQELARGMVILKHPFKLAWDLELEWKDTETMELWDSNELLEYIHFFPEDGLSKILRGFLGSELSPFPDILDLAGEEAKEVKTEDTPKQDRNMSAEDRLVLMADGIDESPKSMLANRLMAQYYLHLEEYESAVEICRKGKNLVIRERRKTGLELEKILDSLDTMLATSLIYYQSPKNHVEAMSIFKSILKRKPTYTAALIGVGLILEDQEDYAGAIDFLSRAIQRDENNITIKAELAWCRALGGELAPGLQALKTCLTEIDTNSPRGRDLKAQTHFRIGKCLWDLDSSHSARKDRKGAYAHFLSSLQANMNYAPAYTSLGIYYADYSKDKKRARKCFQKSFELSASEVVAAERLARAFAEQGDWDLVEIVAERVIDTRMLRPSPGSKKKGVSWPFAARGIVQLNKQDYAKSITAFQAALRLSPEDYHSWVGLGESYHNSGRYIAATKAFQQAETLSDSLGPNHEGEAWFAKYMLSNVSRELGDYEDAIEGYEQVLQLREGEFGVSIALMQTLVDGAWHSIETGFYGRAASWAKRVLEFAPPFAKRHPDAFNLWKAVGDASSVYSFIQRRLDEFPVQALKSLLAEDAAAVYEPMAEIDEIGVSSISNWDDKGDADLSASLTWCLHASILAQKRAVSVSKNDSHARAVAWYNLGWAEHRAHFCLVVDTEEASQKRSSRYLKAAIRCFKRAIELEAGNNEFWNALGLVTIHLNPQISQHSFIRSLHLNDKNARIWTNLGTLYLFQNDYQLANDAFARAQSTDPEYTQAWLGQGLLALLLGDSKEAQSLFTHAFEIADSLSLLTKRQYAISTFDHLISVGSTANIGNLIQPLFALYQLRAQTPDDLASRHLSALYLERIEDYVSAADNLAEIGEVVEQEYENSESAALLARFSAVKADTARSLLAAKDYDGAAEAAEMALQLSSEEAGDERGGLDRTAHEKCRLSAHLTAGLAYYFSGTMDKAIDMYRAALEESGGAPDIVCLLAQVLWAKGGERERGVAREQLLDCVENNPSHLPSRMLLGVIAAFDGDQEMLEGVRSDLQGSRTEKSLTAEEEQQIGQVLMATSVLSNVDDPDSAADRNAEELTEAKVSIMISPSQPYGWSQLADMTDESYPAQMAVKTAQRAVPPAGALKAEDLARAFAGSGKAADVQRAIMMAPSKVEGWRALASLIHS
ncbi:MAG: hypothetical protein M4579_003025 [Chaenotheca gracillima]|nr:MAG: hypothetical protein M4579_003025 [Chaenotheca gracillima]